MSDMSSLCPIGTKESGMGVMVSAPNVEAKVVLEKQQRKKIKSDSGPSNLSNSNLLKPFDL